MIFYVLYTIAAVITFVVIMVKEVLPEVAKSGDTFTACAGLFFAITMSAIWPVVWLFVGLGKGTVWLAKKLNTLRREC